MEKKVLAFIGQKDDGAFPALRDLSKEGPEILDLNELWGKMQDEGVKLYPRETYVFPRSAIPPGLFVEVTKDTSNEGVIEVATNGARLLCQCGRRGGVPCEKVCFRATDNAWKLEMTFERQKN